MAKRKFLKITLTEAQVAAFWRNVKTGAVDECWPWLACLNPKGYGLYNVWLTNIKRYRVFLTHRVAFILHTGLEPEECVLHTCDYAACCNPHHLYDGTDKMNARDREERCRGNHIRGSQVSLAKLIESEVVLIKQQIRSPHSNLSAIAREHGVTQGTIQHIKDGKTWVHIA